MGRTLAKGPRDVDLDESEGVCFTVTMEEDVEFDRDALLLKDAPFGVECDMLNPGFMRLSIAQRPG